MLPYERQLAEKERQVRDALERIGGFESPPVEPIVPAVETSGYRNKLEYSFGESEDGELVLGFHRAGRWDLIDDVTDDVLASERVNEVREAVKAWCREEGLSAWDREDQGGFLRNLVVREGRRTGQLQARLVTSEGDFRAPDLAAGDAGGERALDPRARASPRPPATARPRCCAASRTSRRSCSDLRFRISPDAFFQTNTEMAERSTRPPSSSRASRAASACSTSSAGSGRSPSRWRSTPARCSAWRSWSARWPTRSRTRA